MSLHLFRVAALIMLVLPCCACGREQINEECRASRDGPWAFVGSSAPDRVEIESRLVGLRPVEINSLLGGRKPYRYLTEEKKGFWYIERRRVFSEKPISKKCAEDKFDQSFLIIEIQFDETEKAIACSTQTKEVLSDSIISVLQAEKSGPNPLDGEKRQCGRGT